MPKLRPLPAPQPEALATPPDQEVEIDLVADPPGSAEVDLETGAIAAVSETPAATAPAAPAEEENALQKAIDGQKRAEELQRAAQRERDEARRLAQQRDQELTRERGDREQAQYDTVLSAIAAEQSAVDRARGDYQAARAAGDIQAELEANDRWISARTRLGELESGKTAFDSRREQRPEPARTASTTPEQPRLPKTATDWLEAHPEFKSGVKNSQIGYVHQLVVETEGHEPFSPAYFSSLETHLGLRAAAEPDPEPAPQPQRRSMPVSAPVSRQTPSVTTGRPVSSKMTLSPEERQIARSSFTDESMSNEQKELLYARNKQKLQKMRANGEYRQTTEQTG